MKNSKNQNVRKPDSSKQKFIGTQTPTDRWKEEITNRETKSVLGYILTVLNRHVLSIFGLKLNKINSKIPSPRFLKFGLADLDLIESRNRELAKVFNSFFKTLEIQTDERELKNLIKEFDIILRKSPISNLDGGFSYNNAIALFLFVRLAKPKSLVESGVWRGFTTFIMRQAAPEAEMNCFDINLTNRQYIDSAATYHEYDVTQLQEFRADILFCDDHVPQDSRLIFADSKRIKYIIFDDDLSDFEIHSDGWPAFPTISQIRNAGTSKRTIKWIYDGKIRAGEYSGEATSTILTRYNYVRSPLLFELTGYLDQTRTSFLTMKSDF